MLKHCFTPFNIKKQFNLRCAEIICQDYDTFFIVCTQCELKLFDLVEFMVHYRNVHHNENDVTIQHNDYYEDLEFPEDSTSIIDIKLEPLDEHEISILKNHKKPLKPTEDEPQLPTEQQVFNNFDAEMTNIDEESESESEDLKKDIPNVIKIFKKPKQHICKICNKSYGHPRTLKMHINAKHLGPRNFKCKHCEEKFRNERDLQTHERSVHIGYICHLCGKTYKTMRTLSSHAQSHMTTKNFICPVENCGKAFVSSQRLSRHKLCHSGEAKYVCEQCGFRTKRKSSLILHKHLHTGEKPYECPICNKRFSTVSMRNDHVPIHSNVRPYACDICGATFTRPKALYHHKPIHLAVKKFVCKICGKAYAQAAGLCSHMRTHRKENAELK